MRLCPLLNQLEFYRPMHQYVLMSIDVDNSLHESIGRFLLGLECGQNQLLAVMFHHHLRKLGCPYATQPYLQSCFDYGQQ